MKLFKKAVLLSLLSLSLLSLPAAASEATEARAEWAKFLDGFPATKGKLSEGERIKTLYDRQWQYALREFPEMSTALGVPGRNHLWSDQSLAAMEARRALDPKLLKAVESIDRSKLEEKDRVHYDLYVRQIRNGLEGERFPGEYLALNQMWGLQQSVPGSLVQMPAKTAKEYEDILSRLRGVPTLVEHVLERLEKGLAAGVTPPRITLRDVPGQVKNLITDDPMESALLKPFTKLPESIPAPDRDRLTREAVRAYQEQAAPAFRKLHRYLEETYVPGSRESIAMSALPDGQAWYAYMAKQYTTTDLTPDQIHEIGLAEVKRIRAEMDKVIAATGFKGSFEEFLVFLRTDPQFYYEKPEDLVAAYRDIAKRADPELIKLFGTLPRLPYGVIPMPSYAEKSQTTAYYEDGNLEAGRPGYYNVNTYDLKSRPKWEMEALTLHESVPGHHLQISLAQEQKDVPEWRRFDGYTAFIEGWGLYAESLGEEMGFYKDPYSKFGQLTYEMWRAVRLVVDTGMHAKGWTREQAIDFFKKNAGKTEHDIVVEVDRYIVTPGQALAYKIGELKIKELRAWATKELGNGFDVRLFHDQVLGSGALPLDVLEANVREWVGERKAALAKEERPAS
ncbi:MAG TPA: DUF885 domain-containing protein [Thermoanaerobaculia bacterium]|nr:DUF885 domain-containing protein [Thermoanaerobaculia bacterium]